MLTKTLGFIGGGRVTRIFLRAFVNKQTKLESVVVYDTNPEILSTLKNEFPFITVGDSASITAKQDVVFIALHPPVIMETLEKIQNDVTESTILISLAPKINMIKISREISQVVNIVRMIPNATSFINEGFNPIYFSETFNNSEKGFVLEMLGILGFTFEVAEEKLESYAILSAMLPTYFWFQWKELLTIGNQTGLTEKECKESIQQTLISSMNLMFNSGLSYEQITDLIPVKPIAEHEAIITNCFKDKLLPLFDKIKP
ncbi:pyrroline-5-carboxylate reductase family protein [Bacteroidota bacterium]